MPDSKKTTTNSSDRSESEGYVLPRKNYNIAPPERGSNEAANVIRDKLAKIYAREPDAMKEEAAAEHSSQRSEHQQFIYDLTHSGKDLAQIQTEWHEYYLKLPDDEKHIVWQEFYASNQKQPTVTNPIVEQLHDAEKIAIVRNEMAGHSQTSKQARQDRRDASTIQKEIREHAGKRKLTKKQHLQSLLFGLGVGAVTLVIFLFSFFNEVIIAPFIQPARTSAATPLIINDQTVAPSKDPQIIIPKINVQIPIRFDIQSNTEESMQKELESGIAHYPTTSEPGQNGNAAYFGHSSNNLFNKGQYKFAFVLLHQLVPGDVFYITKDSKLYAYKVFKKTIVEPNQVEVLNPVEGHSATATLITCDPPGTSLRRLVVVGDQITPDPSTNAAAATTQTSTTNQSELTGNGQTLWGRFISTLAGKATVIAVLVLAIFFLLRKPAVKIS